MKKTKRFSDATCLGFECHKKLLFFLAVAFIFLFWYIVIHRQNVKQYEERLSNNLWKVKYGSNKKQESIIMNEKLTGFKGLKIVHIDLKGAPPKISYFKELFPLLSSLGATGLLIEYEDMFPYNGTLRNVSALNSYSLKDIETLNMLARSSNLTVIPLIQTIGHLEFILKLKEFKSLRAVTEYPQVICPNDNRSFVLLFEMIDQIVSAHPHLSMIHIGADEVNYIAQCEPDYDERLWSKNKLFLSHIKEIAKYIRKRYPHLKILMWDDELRNMSPAELKGSKISNLIEPVVWKYTTDVYTDLGPSLWYLYMEIFPKLWVASAFKGATGSSKYLTEVTHHLENHRSWLVVLSEFGGSIDFQGIILTGWQRYDHFAILCELLPVSLSSLALSLRLIMGYNDSPLSPPTEVAKKLQCDQPYGLLGPAFGSPKCSYPGANILDSILRFHQVKQEYENISEDDRYKGWLNNYNIRNSFSNPNLVNNIMSHLQRLYYDLVDIDRDISYELGEVYDEYTVKEWRETYMLPLMNEISQILSHKDDLLTPSYWSRRPLEKSRNNFN